MSERGDSPQCRSELMRSRLQEIEQRLLSAVRESERAGMWRISTVIGACADQVHSLLYAPVLPPTFRVESVIGHAERALAVWVSLKAF